MREDDNQVYFFDTSALVKRYHRELGTDLMDAAFGDKDATRMISDIAVIEFYSVINPEQPPETEAESGE